MRYTRYTDVNTSFRKETRYDYLYTSAIKGERLKEKKMMMIRLMMMRVRLTSGVEEREERA